MSETELGPEVISLWEKSLAPFGLAAKPFLVSWYNDKVERDFRLLYPGDTIALNVISAPRMFERIFLEYVRGCTLEELEGVRDVLDISIKKKLTEVKDEIEEQIKEKVPLKTKIICDYEMNNVTRRPMAAVRTAGHVSGQVRYYQQCDIPNNISWTEGRKISGCSLHHKYGGWFAFRAVIILENVTCHTLLYEEPPDPLNNDPQLIARLLKEFNFNWKCWKFRDIIEVQERYSRACLLYFSIPVGEQRFELIKRWWKILQTEESIDKFVATENNEDLLDYGM